MSNVFLTQDDFERIFKSHLKIETYTKSIESLYSLRLLNRIDYKPYYQRNYVWDNHKATYFIESILLGTEIPPLIFFNNGTTTEVIDGRQRFETIKRFKDSEFALSKKGLTTLMQLAKTSYDVLGNNNPQIIDTFLDAKLRIIEYQIVNEPRLNPDLEDKVKKEIFSRYNSGITPLKKPEIDNAVYDDDPITRRFKRILKADAALRNTMHECFLKQRGDKSIAAPLEPILQFIRKHLVLAQYPIKYFARGKQRPEILSKLYEHFSNNVEDVDALCHGFIQKVQVVSSLRDELLSIGTAHNRYLFECLMWGTMVLEIEGKNPEDLLEPDTSIQIVQSVSDNMQSYSTEDPHHYRHTMNRYDFTAHLLESVFGLSLNVYVGGSSEFKEHIAAVQRVDHTDTDTKLSELETLRITKPEPSRNSIDDIARVMDRRRFLVRPSYQRSEVINLPKASAIIESILLGIQLPPIFVYKRLDGVQEVIDGQQRLLTILGFIGKEYVDEDNQRRTTKNYKFKLRNLRILKELNGKSFHDLSQSQQSIILDFELFVVEIEERLNPHFDPVDLFIRLNDKPYPIKEDSFEMWNSWVDREVIKSIKEKVARNRGWFYVKPLRRTVDRDRMLNEEVYTALAYLEHRHKSSQHETSHLEFYQKTDRINSRIRSKSDITHLLTTVSEDSVTKQEFADSIKQVEKFVSKVKTILIDRDVAREDLTPYLEQELDTLFKAGKESRYFYRRMQDFYLLWLILHDLNPEMVKFHRMEIKKDISDLFLYLKNIPEHEQESYLGYDQFVNRLEYFKAKYSQEDRRTRLTDEEKLQLLQRQGNIDPVSGSPVFLGDEIEVDHIKPLSIGGEDQVTNMQIVHKTSNRQKGASYSEQLDDDE